MTIASVPDYSNNNHWLNLLQIDSEVYGKDRNTLMQQLDSNGIQTRPVWLLNHLQKPYRDCQSYKIEKAEKLVEQSLCVPSSVGIGTEEIQKVISSLV